MARGRPPKAGKPTLLVSFRFPSALIDRLDVFARQLNVDMAWASVSRADAARYLLTYALAELEQVAQSASNPAAVPAFQIEAEG